MIHKPTDIGPHLQVFQVVDGNLCETCSASINYQDITHPDKVIIKVRQKKNVNSLNKTFCQHKM